MARDGVKMISVRVPEDLADRLEAVAMVEGSQQRELIVEALETLIDGRMSDEEWCAKRAAYLGRQRELLGSMD